MEKAADSANSSAKKASETVSQFDKHAEKTEKTLSSWAKEKYEVLLEAKDKISPLVTTIGSGIKSFTSKTWSVTMKAVDLITSPVRGIINLLKNPIFQVGAVLGVSIGLKDTIETYKDFEAAMSQVQAISGATGSEMTKLTDKAKEMGATTKFTAAESAEAFNYMAMAGWKTEDMLGGIEGILNLAAASGESLGTTSDIVTDALTAFGMTASEAGRFADVMAAASSNANTNVSMMGETFKYAGAMAGTLKYSIEDVALATGLMANAGIKGNMAGTALNSIFTRLSTNTNGAADALNKLGIAYFNSDGSARDFSDIMKELREATADFSDEQKAVLGNTIAGTYAQKGFLAILNASEADYNKLADAINNADGAAAGMSETMLDNLQGSITLLQSAVDGVKLSFGERLSPYVRGLADWLTAQMPAIEQGLEEFMDWLDTKVERMQRKFNEITGTKEWQDADLFGKVKIAWDEFIVEPFSEWWGKTGKAKFAEFAQNIGEGIGTGLKAGIMTMLGIDIGETVDEGVSIGASFAKGFSDGFDFETVSKNLWQGFKNLLSNAGKLLPGGESADLSSLLSAIMLSKIVSPFIGLGRGIAGIGKGMFGVNAVTGTSLVGSLLGTTGNAMVSGSGILGSLANIGYGISGGSSTAGMYFGSMEGAMSGGAAALTGAGVVAGGAAAGATIISGGMDAYKAFKSDDADEAQAYGASAGLKWGGVGAGAAIGTLILPGIGTVIGAGIGGIAGWIAGNKVKESYEEELEEAQKAAANAQKAMEVTGLSIDEVTFANKDLQEALHDSEVSAEQFAQMFQEECANVAKKAFGDVTLSLTEIKRVASEITFADMADELNGFAQATAETESASSSLQLSATNLKKENWKVNLGMTLSDTDKDNYKNAIADFINTSQTFIDDNHYEATVALKLLTGEEADTTKLDSYYGGLNWQMEYLGAQLTAAVDDALKDGVISDEKIILPDGTLQLSEAEEIENLQKQISEITSKLADAKTDAEFEALKIKHNGAALDVDSFNALQEELQASVASASEQYESALTLTLTNLNLQLADEDITQAEYKDAVAEATEGYYVQIDELNARVSGFNLESIAAAWDSKLADILPDIEGSTTEKLTHALNSMLSVHPDVSSWTTADVISWMGLDKIDLDTAEQTTIATEMIQTALAVPEGTKESLMQDLKDLLPTTEEIEEMGTVYGDALNNGASASLLTGASRFRSDLQTALDAATANSFTISPTVNVTPNYNTSGFMSPALWQNIGGNAAGGYVSGGPQLSWLAEEGYGEFVIPTNPSRRSRALELYEQAGAALGVSAHADGGYVGGSILRDTAINYNFNDVNRNVPLAYNETTEGNYNEETAKIYEPVSASAIESAGGSPIQVNVNMTPEFVISGDNGQSEESIMKVIRRHMKEMADELGGEIAERLSEVFSNMPLKEA